MSTATATAGISVEIISLEDVTPSPEAIAIAQARPPSDPLYGIAIFE